MPRTPRAKKPAAPGVIVTAHTAEEVAKLASEAPGPVVLDFVEEGCPACEEEAPEVEEAVKGCGNVTIIRADATKDESINALADAWGINGFPTMFYADKAVDLKPGVAAELGSDDEAPVDALRRRMKCPRTPAAPKVP